MHRKGNGVVAVGGGGSGLEVAAQAMSLVVLNSPEEWEKRRDALLTMQKAVEEQAEKSSGQSGGNPVFVADLWRLMKEPLKHTLNDLRSAIVKEACHLLEKISTAAGNSMAGLMRDMISVLLQLLANGNSVIVGQVDACMRHVIAHSRFPRQLKEVEYLIRNSRSAHLREYVASYVLLILKTWPSTSMDKEAVHLDSIISVLLEDASSAARTDARASFGIFYKHWRKRAENILKAVEPRTAKTLREELQNQEGLDNGGSWEQSSVSSLTSAPGGTKGGGGGASRVLNTKPKGLKNGSSSAESLRGAGGGTHTAYSPMKGNKNRPTTASSSSTTASAANKKKNVFSSSYPSLTTTSPTTSSQSTGLSRTAVSKQKKGSTARRRPYPASATATTTAAVAAGGGMNNNSSNGSITPLSTTTPTKVTSPSSASQTKQQQRKIRPPSTPPNNGASTPSKGGLGVLLRPGRAATSPLLVSADGFLAAGGGGGVYSGSGFGMPSSPPMLEGSSSACGSVVESEGLSTALVQGDKVLLKGAQPRSATVRYVGETQFATGVWVGVELAPGVEPAGNNDGAVNGVCYFVCPPARGIFLRPDMVDLAIEHEEEGGAGGGIGVVEEGEHGHRISTPEKGTSGPENGTSPPERGTGSLEKDEMKVARAEAAKQAGSQLLRCHKLFVNEAMETLKDEMVMIPGLEKVLLGSEEAIPLERLRSYLDMLESAAEVRAASAARLRAQIRETARKHPSIFLPPLASPTAAAAGGVAVAVGVSGWDDSDGDGDDFVAAKDLATEVVEGENGRGRGVLLVQGGKEVAVAPNKDGSNGIQMPEKEASGRENSCGGEGGGGGEEMGGIVGQVGIFFRKVLNGSDNDKHEDGGKKPQGGGGKCGVADAATTPTTPTATPAYNDNDGGDVDVIHKGNGDVGNVSPGEEEGLITENITAAAVEVAP